MPAEPSRPPASPEVPGRAAPDESEAMRRADTANGERPADDEDEQEERP